MKNLPKINYIASPSCAPRRKKYMRARNTLRVLMLIIPVVAMALSMRVMGLLAPLIRLDLHLNEGQIGFAAAALIAGTMIATLPMGVIVDRVDSRLSLAITMAVLSLSFLGVAHQRTFIGLVVSLFIIGMVISGILPSVNKLVTRVDNRGQRGLVMGLLYAGFPLAGFVGAVVLPAIGEFLGWKAGFHLLAVTTFAGGLICWRVLPADKATQQKIKSKFPYIKDNLNKFLLLSIAHSLFAFSLSSMTFLILFLVDVVKTSIIDAGVYIAISSASAVVGRILLGLLAAMKFSKKRLWLLSFTVWLGVVSFALLSIISSRSTSLTIIIAMVAIGTGGGSSYGILSTVVVDIVGKESTASATAIMFFMTNIGLILGTIIFGSLLQAGNSYHLVLKLFGSIAALAALLFTWISINRSANSSE